MRDGNPVFSSEQGPTVTEAHALDITVPAGSDVSLTFLRAGHNEITADEVADRLFLVTPGGHLEADRMEAPDGYATGSGSTGPVNESTPEVILVFEDTPPLGLLAYGDQDHEPHAHTIQPVSACYDAEEGTFSTDFDTCLPEIAEQND